MKLAILGLGNVGRAFAEQLARRQGWLKDTLGIEPRLVGAADRTGVLIAQGGLDSAALARIKSSGGTLAAAQAAGIAELLSIGFNDLCQLKKCHALAALVPTQVSKPFCGCGRLMCGKSLTFRK
jgi:homoserine dehydrogenase